MDLREQLKFIMGYQEQSAGIYYEKARGVKKG
ncbi:Uncharacterised protein [Hafnia alvei]|jgi:hypothetical protein|nr:Uncharacterised protein [Hafnia alvei]